jgi:outer membrane lipoprotein SlyB
MLLMRRPIFIIPALVALLLTGCIATAPVSIAWRSNTTLQYATTEGKNDRAADANTVNADRTTETQAALSTSSGTAATAPQDARNKTAQEAAQ